MQKFGKTHKLITCPLLFEKENRCQVVLLGDMAWIKENSNRLRTEKLRIFMIVNYRKK
jgi:hypothetical protein